MSERQTDDARLARALILEWERTKILAAERDSLRAEVAEANNRAQALTFLLDEARALVRSAADVDDDESMDAAFGKCNAAVARWDAEKAEKGGAA